MSCKHDSKAIESAYLQAQEKFDHGDIPGSLSIIQDFDQTTEDAVSAGIWKLRILQAEILVWSSDYNKAEQLLKSKPPLDLPPEFVARRRLAQARVLYFAGDFDESAAYIDEAKKSAEASYPDLLPEVSLARGTLLELKGQEDEAEKQLKVAREAAQNRHKAIVESRALANLARLYTLEGNYDEAIDFGLLALETAQSVDARHVEALAQDNLGWNYREFGDFDQAIPALTRCQKLAAAANVKQIEMSCLNNLGRIDLTLHKYQDAHDYFAQALDIASHLSDDVNVAVYSDNLAIVSIHLGLLAEAETYNQAASAIHSKLRNHEDELRSKLTSGWIAAARNDSRKAKAIVQSVVSDPQVPGSLQWEADDVMAEIYRANNQNDDARKQFEKALESLQRARPHTQDEQKRLAFSSVEAGFYSDYIRFLADRKDCAGSLRVSELGRGRTLEEALGQSEPGVVSLPAIQNFLRTQGKIILSYWLAPETAYLWVVTPSQCQLFPLRVTDHIENAINDYQRRMSSVSLHDSVEPGDAEGQELYRFLVGQAKDLIPPRAQVVIIPDGNLEKLSFGALAVPESPAHFWIEDVQIEETNSIALLVKSRSRISIPKTVLAIGDPPEVTADFGKLPSARQELSTAASHFPLSKIISGSAATPSLYAKSNPGNYDVIHFATHGFASELQPLQSAIILAADQEGSFKLYGSDIIRTHLNATVVTISACYGAGKRTYSGEGLVGLAWAFLGAGAHHVVAGLWNVEDQSTPALMDTFYKELAAGKSAATALHDAKLKMLHSDGPYRLPYYWGVLQLYTGS